MTSNEAQFRSETPPEPEAQRVFDELLLGVETRYMEALDKQYAHGGVVWVASERMELPDEQAMWFRLSAERELKPGIDSFDVGIPVVDPLEPRPRPVLADASTGHFFVRTWKRNGSTTETVTPNKSQAYANLHLSFPRPLVPDLATKLQNYHLHILRTRHDPSSVA